MQHIDKIEKFFEFLEEHLESGFEKIKRTYSLGYYDEFFDATRNDNTDEPILVDKGGYIVTDPITGNEEYFDEDIYLNPFKQIKRIDVRRQGENEIINSYEVSLYNDLHKFYFSEFQKFKRKFYQSIVINFPSSSTKEFLTNFFIAIEDFQERAENPKFSVKNEKCEDIQLLNFFLQSLVDKIKQKYLNQESSVNNQKNKDATAIRQAYIIELLLKTAECSASSTAKAKFINFLIGKSTDNIRQDFSKFKKMNKLKIISWN
jgi:hypothetical protein